MTSSDQKLLIDACENPGAFMDMAESFIDHPENGEQLLAEYLAKIKLNTRISYAKLKLQFNPWIEDEIKTPTVIFRLKSDNQTYILFGILDDNEKVHVVLASYDPSKYN